MTDVRPAPSSLLRSAGVVGLMTLLSRITGVFTRRITAYYLGGDAIADAFTVAWRLPNLLRRFTAEGTMTSAFLPSLSEVEATEGQAGVQDMVAKFLGTLATTLALVCAVAMVFMGAIMGLQMIGRVAPGLPFPDQLAVLGQILAGQRQAPSDVVLAIGLGRLMFPYLALVSVTAGLSAVLNLRHRFALPASVSTFFNLAFIGFGALFVYLDRQATPARIAFWFALATLLAGIVQVAILVPAFRKLGFGFRWGLHFSHPGVASALKRMVPGLLGTGIHPINVYISMLLVSQLPAGAQTVLMNANVLGEMVLGIFSASIATVSLPTMSRQVDAGDLDGLRDSLARALRGTAVLAIPAAVGLAVLAEPISALLFRTGRYTPALVTWTAQTLAWQAFGILFVATGRITSQCLYALKDYKTPATAALIGVGCNIAFSMLLLRPMGTQGISLANGLAALVNLAILATVLRRRLHRPPFAAVLRGWLVFGAAAALMGLAAWGLGRAATLDTFRNVWNLAGRLFPVIAASSLAYFTLLFLFRVPEARDLAQLLARKLRLPVGH